VTPVRAHSTDTENREAKILDHLQNYCYSKPGRITGLGRALVLFGAFLLLGGAIGRVATGAINILPTLVKQPETEKNLADLYPTWPLWWVPESWLGVVAVAVLIVVGICIALHGDRVDRMLKTF
jgi:hypothetical protein